MVLFKLRPAGELLKLPPPVPVMLTETCPPVLVHNMPEPYVMVANGNELIVMPMAVDAPFPQAFCGVTVSVPAVAPVEKLRVFDGVEVRLLKLAPVPEKDQA